MRVVNGSKKRQCLNTYLREFNKILFLGERSEASFDNNTGKFRVKFILQVKRTSAKPIETLHRDAFRRTKPIWQRCTGIRKLKSFFKRAKRSLLRHRTRIWQN